MSGHTPGPWGSYAYGIYSAEVEACHDGKYCAEVGHCPTECGPQVLVALGPDLIEDIKIGHWDDVEQPKLEDLRLMAAAPELLEALESVLANCLDSEGLFAAYAKARAAIAKARGEQP